MIAALEGERQKHEEENRLSEFPILAPTLLRISPARPNSRPRSPGDVDEPPRKRQSVSEQSTREIYRTSGAPDVTGPSTSSEVADPVLDTTADFDDVDMLTVSVEDSDAESRGSELDDRPESQCIDENLSVLRISEEEQENANRSMLVRTLAPTSFQC